MFLKGKTIVISGASRGIGKAIALRAAKDGANIAILAKTTEAHPKLPGTIYSAAQEIESLGAQALPIRCDLREEADIDNAIRQIISKFGGIDILINNASAISLTPVAQTTSKKYDLMHSINARGSFLLTAKALPYLRQARNPHVLFLSPPLGMKAEWFSGTVAYTASKMTMSMWVLGMSQEFKEFGIAVNALWPKTLIATAALQAISAEGASSMAAQGRTPEITADAAYAIICQPATQYTGNFCIDEQVLMHQGIRDFSKYKVTPGSQLQEDFFVDSQHCTHPLPKPILLSKL